MPEKGGGLLLMHEIFILNFFSLRITERKQDAALPLPVGTNLGFKDREQQHSPGRGSKLKRKNCFFYIYIYIDLESLSKVYPFLFIRFYFFFNNADKLLLLIHPLKTQLCF